MLQLVNSATVEQKLSHSLGTAVVQENFISETGGGLDLVHRLRLASFWSSMMPALSVCLLVNVVEY